MSNISVGYQKSEEFKDPISTFKLRYLTKVEYLRFGPQQNDP